MEGRLISNSALSYGDELYKIAVNMHIQATISSTVSDNNRH
jgi:hypothetical protein